MCDITTKLRNGMALKFCSLSILYAGLMEVAPAATAADADNDGEDNETITLKIVVGVPIASAVVLPPCDSCRCALRGE